MEKKEKLVVTVLLEKHPPETIWTATTPAVGGIVAEGESPEEATKEVETVIKDVFEKYPEVREKLSNPPEYLLTQVEIKK
jgi:predicted RNase H-like HicB family nuclease